MTLDPIAALPAIASVAVMFAVSVDAAFFRVYVPVLLLLPDNYWWGWARLSFHQYAILPIALGLLWWVINGRWRLSLNDITVFGFIGWMIVADLHSNGTVDIITRMMTILTLAVFPYMAGKLLIEQPGLRIAFARRFIFLIFIDCGISVYEFLLGVNPFRRAFGHLFTVPDPWFTQIRYGVGRTAGPFSHAILMGTIVAVAILLHRYTMRFGFWEKRFRWLPTLNLDKGKILMTGLVAGSIMTISRGPWIAAVVGIMIAAVGVARHRGRTLRRNLLILAVGGGLIYVGAKAYVAGSGTYGPDEDRASAEYRAELVNKYAQFAMLQPKWGWGSTDWPRVKGMDSVDNWYLLIALMYGVTGVVLFVLMMGTAFLLLLRDGMMASDLNPEDRGFFFTMAGILLCMSVALATVYLGAQVYPILFLFLGWSDACRVYRPQRSLAIAPAFAFRRVIA